MKDEYLVKTVKETHQVARDFSKKIELGNIVLLTGKLGAGKTTFVQGIGEAIDVKSRIISPTFTLIRKHKGKKDGENIHVYHIDLYRLGDIRDIKNIGIDDVFEDTKGIFLIEWGERYENLAYSWKVNIEILKEGARKIEIYKNE